LADVIVDGQPTWKPYQTTPATLQHVKGWYRRGLTGCGVCGGVNGLEPFEFDDRATYDQFKRSAIAVGIGDLVERIDAGYSEESPSGGIHLMYRLSRSKDVKPPTKLAERPDPAKPNGRKTLIETKGRGGFIIVAPSCGKVHPTGGAYRLLRGGVETIATITVEERDALWDLARSFDEMPEVKPSKDPPKDRKDASNGEMRPGEAYEAENSWEDILEPLGWIKVFSRGDTTYWRRPGKDLGVSATTGHCKGLYVFSTSTKFEARKSYTKFGAYAALHHNGDHAAAARELAKLGYGAPSRPRPNGVAANRFGGSGPPPSSNGHQADDDGSLDARLAEMPRTDCGNGERFALRHGTELRYCHPWSKWLHYDGRRWKIDDVGAVRRLAKDTARLILKEASTISYDDERRKAHAKFAFATEAKERINAMIIMATSEEGIPILPDDLDRNGWLFNCPNGTLNLETGHLRGHRREDCITQLCPVEYDPSAECPLWEQTLRLFLAGDAELIDYLQRLCGYAMVGVIRDHILPIAYGSGNNGKSTILGTLLETFGPDYAMKCPPDMLMAKKQEAHSTDRTDLFRKRLVVAIETEAGRRLNETMVKELTGGDRIRARRMREDNWEFAPTHTIVMATNHKPVIRGTDKGIWRRPKLIPFTVSVEGNTDDKTMPEKLRAEQAGILAWCVRGCVAWQKRGLDEPAAVKLATEEYRREQDVLADFLEEHTVQGPQFRVRCGELHARYVQETEKGKQAVMSLTAFGEAMRERGFQTQRSMGKWYLGIALRDDQPTS
jgi:putative DNA primase/helicase